MDEGYDAINVARAYDIAACRPLADLPPEAMEVRSDRARSGPPSEPGLEPTDEPGPEPTDEPGPEPTDEPALDGAE
jgi:hypothetical protein